MPRGRMLNKEISTNKHLPQVSNHARLLFTWMIPHLDSGGKFFGNPTQVKGIVVPYLKEYTENKIEKCLVELEEIGLITIYGDTCKYIYYNGFADNQTINIAKEAKSIIPDPTPEELQSNARITPPEVKLSKEKRSKDETHPSFEEVNEYFIKKQSSTIEAKKFYAHYSSNGWRVGKNPMVSWRASVAGWIIRNEEKSPKKQAEITHDGKPSNLQLILAEQLRQKEAKKNDKQN
jgi:hypothetical protein